MAMPHDASSLGPKIQIEGVQTVTPCKMTDQREIRNVSVTNIPIGQAIFKGCLNIVLCYNKVTEMDSGWVVAGWIKESLAKALREQPLISGRLRRGEDGNGGLEIVSNDSGTRLLEAKIETTMQEFLDLKVKDKVEAELVHWKEIDEQNPQFSPLFYVQVTNFQCGGYSIGISCSLLLADLIITVKFLQKWARIQKDILSRNEALKVPIFYLPNLKPPNLSSIISSSPSNNPGQTCIFKIADKTLNLKDESCKENALLCINEAEKQNGCKMLSEFSFVVKESPEVIRVENIEKHELVESQLNLKSCVSSASWDDMGIKEIAFYEENKPVHVSHWIGSITDGFVMTIPNPDEGTSEVNILVAIPCEMEI